MPYAFPTNIPRPAMNWGAEEQRKCVAAANAVLARNGSEQDAIFACIHAAGRTENPGGKTMSVFERLRQAFDGWLKTIEDGELEGSDLKAVWTTAMVNDLPDSCFLYIEPGKGKDSEGKTVPRSARHFPYKDAEGQVDMPHLRNAIARIPQSNAPGLDKQALQKRAQAMLERMNNGMKGESGLAVYKQADGAYRWVGWVSNHFRDNDNPREILSAKAHRDFVAYADKTGKYPELWLWHVPGSRIGQADMVDFADGFLIESGLFDPGKEKAAVALAKDTDPLTMSHGFIRTEPMTKEGVTDGYIQFEASITPKGPEANPWTAFQTIKEADMPLNETKKAFLAKYLPMETIIALEGKTEELRKAAEAAGVDWKAVEGDDPTGVASTDPTPAAAPAAPTVFNPAEFVDALAGPVAEAVIAKLELGNLSDSLNEVKAKADKYDALAEQVTALTEVVKALKKSDDDKIADTLTPKAVQAFAWMGKAASKSPDNVIDPDDEKDKALVSQKPFLADIAEKMAAVVAAGR